MADGFWSAKKGRDALKVEWDEGPLASLDSAKQLEEYAGLAKKKGAVAIKKGDVANAEMKFEAVYDLPYLAHAPMEPLNCVADVRADSCEVWVGTQFQTLDRNMAARIAGVKASKGKAVQDPAREKEVLTRRRSWAAEQGLGGSGVTDVFEAVIRFSRSEQRLWLKRPKKK